MNTRNSFLSFSNGRFGVKSSYSVRNRCRSRSPPMQIADGIYADRVRCPCRSRPPSMPIAGNKNRKTTVCCQQNKSTNKQKEVFQNHKPWVLKHLLLYMYILSSKYIMP